MTKAKSRARILYLAIAVILVATAVFFSVRYAARATGETDTLVVFVGKASGEESKDPNVTYKYLADPYIDPAMELIRAYFGEGGDSAISEGEKCFAQIILCQKENQVMSDSAFASDANHQFGDLIADKGEPILAKDGKMIKEILVKPSDELIPEEGKMPEVVIRYKQTCAATGSSGSNTDHNQVTYVVNNYHFENVQLAPQLMTSNKAGRINAGWEYITLGGNCDVNLTFGKNSYIWRNYAKSTLMTILLSQPGTADRAPTNQTTLNIESGNFNSVYFVTYAPDQSKLGSTITGANTTLNVSGGHINNLSATDGCVRMMNCKATVNIMPGAEIEHMATLGADLKGTDDTAGTRTYRTQYRNTVSEKSETVDFDINITGGTIGALNGVGYKLATRVFGTADNKAGSTVYKNCPLASTGIGTASTSYTLNGSVDYKITKDATIGNFISGTSFTDAKLDAFFMPINGQTSGGNADAAKTNMKFICNADVSATYEGITFAAYPGIYHNVKMGEGATYSSILNGCTVTGDYSGGGMVTNVNDSASKGMANINNTLTDTTVGGVFSGANSVTNLSYVITNTLTHVTMNSVCYGAAKTVGASAATDGMSFGCVNNIVTSNENGRSTFNGAFYGSAETGNVFGTLKNKIEHADFKGVFYGTSLGSTDGKGGNVHNANGEEVAYELYANDCVFNNTFIGVTDRGGIGFSKNTAVTTKPGKAVVTVENSKMCTFSYGIGGSNATYPVTVNGDAVITFKNIDVTGKYNEATEKYADAHLYAGIFAGTVNGTYELNADTVNITNGWFSGSIHNNSKILNNNKEDVALKFNIKNITCPNNWVAAVGASAGASVNGGIVTTVHGVNTIGTQGLDKGLYCGPRMACTDITFIDTTVGGEEGDKTTVYGPIYGAVDTQAIGADTATAGTYDVKVSFKDIYATGFIYACSTTGRIYGTVNTSFENVETTNTVYGVSSANRVMNKFGKDDAVVVSFKNCKIGGNLYGVENSGMIGATKSGNVKVTMDGVEVAKNVYAISNTSKINNAEGGKAVSCEANNIKVGATFFGALGSASQTAVSATGTTSDATFGEIGIKDNFTDFNLKITNSNFGGAIFGFAYNYKAGYDPAKPVEGQPNTYEAKNYYPTLHGNASMYYENVELKGTPDATTGVPAATHLYAGSYACEIDGTMKVDLNNVYNANGWITASVMNYALVNNLKNEDYAIDVNINGVTTDVNYMAVIGGTAGVKVNGNVRANFSGKNTFVSKAQFKENFKAYDDSYMKNGKSSSITMGLYCGPRGAITGLQNLEVNFANGKNDKTVVNGICYLATNTGKVLGDVKVNANNIQVAWDCYAVSVSGAVSGNVDVNINNLQVDGSLYTSAYTSTIGGVQTLSVSNTIVRTNFLGGPWYGKGILNSNGEKYGFKATYTKLTLADRDLKYDKYSVTTSTDASGASVSTGKITPTAKENYACNRCGTVNGDVDIKLVNCAITNKDGTYSTSSALSTALGTSGSYVYGTSNVVIEGGVWGIIHCGYNWALTDETKGTITNNITVTVRSCTMSRFNSYDVNPIAKGATVKGVIDLTGSGDVKVTAAMANYEKSTWEIKAGKKNLVFDQKGIAVDNIDLSSYKTLNIKNVGQWPIGTFVTFTNLKGAKTLQYKDNTKNSKRQIELDGKKLLVDGAPHTVVVGDTFAIRTYADREMVSELDEWSYYATDEEYNIVKQGQAAGSKKKTIDGVDFICVDIDGISPADFDTVYTLNVTGQEPVKLSVNQILQKAIVTPEKYSPEFIEFAKALFNYGVNYHNKYSEDKQDYELYDVSVGEAEEFEAKADAGCEGLKFVGTSMTVENSIRINFYCNINYTKVNKAKSTLTVNGKKMNLAEYEFISVDKDVQGTKANAVLTFNLDNKLLGQKLEVEFTYRNYSAKITDSIPQYCKDVIKLNDASLQICKDVLALATATKVDF